MYSSSHRNSSSCLEVLAEKVVQNNAVEDKKIKKELQVSIDIYFLMGGLIFSRTIMENYWTLVLSMSEDQPIKVLGSVVAQKNPY